jgi:sugar-specific transcriptional regulator TrmB
MYKEHLIQSGLSTDQATVYELLINQGPLTAGKISQRTPLKRGLVYKILEQLEESGLVDKEEKPGKVAVFIPCHPNKLKELVEKRQQQAKDAQATLDSILPSIISTFNLVSGQPGVQFYEGLNGIKKVLEDTLTNNPDKEILAFSDVAGYVTYLKDWNQKYYAPRRRALGIKEKVIIPNNAKALDYMHGYQASELTEILFIDHQLFPFATEINVYGNKVSFVTFSNKQHISAIIDNEEIAKTLRSIFKFCWQTGQQTCRELQPNWSQTKKANA